MSLQTAGGEGGSGFAGGDTLGNFFYPLYRRMFSENSDFVADVEKKLAEARMSETVEMFLSRSLGIGVVSGFFLWIVGVVLGYLIFATGLVQVGTLIGPRLPEGILLEVARALRVPFLIVVTGLGLGTIGFGIGFGTMVAIPYSRSSTRQREINMLLSDSVSFMYALSVGGLNQLEILEAMAKAEDTYGEVAREFQSLVQETQYFDTDYRTAVRKQSMQTPSDELAQFFTDMLSIINSGGDMTRFLEDKKEKHMRTAKQEQEVTLETLELFGEMYMTLAMAPLLLIIIFVVMGMMGRNTETMIIGTVYGMIPLVGVGFLVLISTVKQDEPGDGYLRPEGSDKRLEQDLNTSILNLGLIESFVGDYSVFDRIKSREGTYETVELLRAPHLFFRDNPLYTLVLTIPAATLFVVVAVAIGSAPTTIDGFKTDVVWGSVVYIYLPLYVVLVPLVFFREWNVYTRHAVIGKLSDNLRKLASANDTGMTLLESVDTVATTSSGKLAEEFEAMYAKVEYGMSLKEALTEFNNKYHIPRLARTVKLISKSQEASSQISAVLTTAAQASENQDDIDRERKSRTRMQVVIIMMTFLTLLGVMALLKTQFIDTMAALSESAGGSSGGGGGGGGGGAGGATGAASFSSIDTDLLSLLFFHAVTFQAILSGIISGYIRDGKIMSGLKFVVILISIALGTWMVVA